MNFTFTTSATGYTILNNGVPWIVQDGYMPYPMPTLAESAQAHIDELVAADVASKSHFANIQSLQAQIDALTILILQQGGALIG